MSLPKASAAPSIRRGSFSNTRPWASWPDERLLELRMCDLGLRIEGTALEERVKALYSNLQARGLRFRPHVWLADEWFCPDGVAGIAIPFYLAHARLMRLERTQMLEVEGGTPEWCLKLLRHEAGHAIENAFGLRKRPRRIQLFGDTKEPYPDHYAPRPYSRRFVVHLDGSYAQAHPDEDFAETFAVWVDPESDWRADYRGWPALRKLSYVDELMKELRNLEPAAAEAIQELCRRSYRILMMSGYARIDLRITEQGRAFVIEANPNPQLSQDEDFSQSAKAAGLKYAELIQRLLSLGLRWETTAN